MSDWASFSLNWEFVAQIALLIIIIGLFVKAD